MLLVSGKALVASMGALLVSRKALLASGEILLDSGARLVSSNRSTSIAGKSLYPSGKTSSTISDKMLGSSGGKLPTSGRVFTTTVSSSTSSKVD